MPLRSGSADPAAARYQPRPTSHTATTPAGSQDRSPHGRSTQSSCAHRRTAPTSPSLQHNPKPDAPHGLHPADRPGCFRPTSSDPAPPSPVEAPTIYPSPSKPRQASLRLSESVIDDKD